MHTEVYGDAMRYQPICALVVYGNGQNGNSSFLTTHKIEQSKSGLVMGPGVLADKAALKSVMKKLNPRAKSKPELLHPRTLAKGDGYHLWWLPPGNRMVWFNAEGIGKRNGVTPHPGLVFMVSDKGWHVYAIKGKKRPAADTALYVAPYLNVWSGGGICTGTANTPKGKAAGQPEAWETPFFESEFTHTNYHGDKCTTLKGGIYTLWQNLLDGKHNKFPERALVPHGFTLQTLLNQIDP